VISNDSDFDDFEDSEEGPDLGLWEKPGALHDYLYAQCNRVMRSHFRSFFGLPIQMELILHDCLIHQLKCELNCHHFKVSDL